MSLQDSLSKYHEQREHLDRMKANWDALMKRRGISFRIIRAAQESLEEAQSNYSEAIGTPSEPASAEAVKQARGNLQQVKDCHVGLEAKIEQEYPRELADAREREREAEERRLETLRARVLREVMEEEIDAISPDTINHLYRAYAARGTHTEWGVWLSRVFPTPIPKQVAEALDVVLTSHGIE